MHQLMHESVWEQKQVATSFPQLQGKHETDVVVIGAGVTGLTAAWLLKQQGKNVIVLESHHVGGGATGHSTSHLTTAYDYDYETLYREYGEETCRLVAGGLSQSINLVEQLVNDLGITCGFRHVPGYYFAESEDSRDMIIKEFETIQSLGLFPVELTEKVPLPFPMTLGIRFEQQAEMDPLAYVQQLAAAVDGDGSRLYEHSRVIEIEDGVVRTEAGQVIADAVVLATHSPPGRSPLHVAIAPYRSYVLGFSLNNSDHSAANSRDPIDGLFWDTKDPYNYIRRCDVNGQSLVVVGGSDHKTGHNNELEAFSRLETYVRTHFDVGSIEARWSAQFYEPVDHLPLIGAMPLAKNTYVATGYSGDGITFGSLAGMMITEQICGRATPYDEQFHPARVNLQGVKDFVKETADAAKSFVVGHLPFAGTDGAPSSLASGEGAICNVRGKKVAAFRSEKGELRTFSAVCPHLGCAVHWNNANQTFDCPCHGSRFDTHGAVIEGPSLRPLSEFSTRRNAGASPPGRSAHQ